VVTNPVSNLKLAGSDIFLYHRLRGSQWVGRRGVVEQQPRPARRHQGARVQKHAAHDPAMPSAEALEIAQGRRSPLLGGRPIEVGAPADLLLIDTGRPEMIPGSLVDNLVYASSGEVVDTTIVAGEVVMRHRDLGDTEQILYEAQRCAHRITSS
jgi:5-methylthioadenosine/S-adenosylhomocysteine deaminase